MVMTLQDHGQISTSNSYVNCNIEGCRCLKGEGGEIVRG